MNLQKSRSVTTVRVVWILLGLLALALFLAGTVEQANRLSRGMLGIWISQEGSMITSVVPESSAEKAGLKAGDTIYSLDQTYDSAADLWFYRLVYRPPDGVKQTVLIEPTIPQHLPFSLPIRFYAWLSSGFDVVFFLVFFGLGSFIVWRAGNESDRLSRRFALVAAFSLLITGFRIPPEGYLVLQQMPDGKLLETIIRASGYVIFPLFLSLFPNGRWFPRYIWIYPLVGLAYPVIFFTLGAQSYIPTLWMALADLVIIGAGVAAQVIRYAKVSSPLERQQTKWALFGIGASFIIYYTFQVIQSSGNMPNWFPFLGQSQSAMFLYLVITPQLLSSTLLLIPLTLAFSILRYRLWDIDLIIRRTLAYSLVTSLMAGIYYLLVVLLQQLLRLITGESSTLAVIFSTLAITLLFVPIRRGVQELVDRRFYRSKYDSEQTAERFSAAVRSEVDFDYLSAELVKVVEDTLHPNDISLWMAPPKKE